MRGVIIGGSGHFEYALHSEATFEVVGYAPGHPSESLESLSPELEGVTFYESVDEMLEQKDPKIAVINPRFDLNGSMIIKCLERGVHCFCEKPLSFKEEELDRIEELLQEQDVQLCPMMIHRYEPWFFAAWEAIREGEIGDPIQIVARKSYKMGEKADWMKHKEKFGGLIPWVGAHAIDLIQWYSSSKLKPLFTHQTRFGNCGQGEVESSAVCVFELENGGQAVAHLDYLRPEKAGSHGDDGVRIIGTEGVVEVSGSRVTLISEGHGSLELPQKRATDMFEDFLNQIKGNGPCRISAREAVELTSLCIASEKLSTTSA